MDSRRFSAFLLEKSDFGDLLGYDGGGRRLFVQVTKNRKRGAVVFPVRQRRPETCVLPPFSLLCLRSEEKPFGLFRVSFGKEGRKRKIGNREMETDGRAGKQTDKNPPQASRRFPDTHNRSEKERECFERAFPGIFHCNSSASSVFLKAPGFFMQA